MKQNSVVITGIGVVSPFGAGREEFRRGLLEGRSGVRRISAFDAGDLAVQIAAEVPEDSLPAPSAGEARNESRTLRFARAAAGEAFADAGLDPQSWGLEEQRDCGVILGTGGGSWEFTERQYRRFLEGARRSSLSLYAVPSSTAGNLSSALSAGFGLRGPSWVVSTGCASSTDALGWAFREIRSGRLRRIVAGGADAVITPSTMAGFALMGILARGWEADPSRASRPFSRSRSGLVVGEGAWMFILENGETARARGARVYGRILGYGATCSAYHGVRLDAEAGESVRAIRIALDEAGLVPEDVQYVSLHGTSTVQNDKVETRIMHEGFGRHAWRLAAGAVKSMIGHPQGASGAASLAATLLAGERGLVHPTVNLEDPDPECDLDCVPEGPRRLDWVHALCHTLSFGSKNAALVVGRG